MPRRWWALAVLALVQFIIVIDNTVVNVALPSVQRALGFSAGGLAWVVNGYLLTAGGLLLFGGRLGDVLGRRRMFLAGAAVFGLASAVCGTAAQTWVMVAGRFVQGMGEALASPAALSLIAVLFTDRSERSKAVGIWGALAGLGATVGVLLSGVLTQLASWRWVFFINVPFVVAALVLVPWLVPESRATEGRRSLNPVSAVLVTAGLLGVVDGLLAAGRGSWYAAGVVVPLAAGAAALLAFVLVEAQAAAPLVPLRFFAHRTRVAANVTTVFTLSVLAAMFLLLTVYLQDGLGYSALRTGLAYLPFCVAFVLGVTMSVPLTARLGVRVGLVTALAIAAVGMLLLARVGVHASYPGTMLPAMLVIAVGHGMAFPAIQAAALRDVSERDAGLAAGIQTTMQAVSAALGVAAFVAIALSRSHAGAVSGLSAPAAAVAGYRTAFEAMAASLVLGAVAAAFISGGRPVVRTADGS